MKTKEEYVEKDVEPIYKGKIDLKKNPVLRPILKLNKDFINLQKQIDRLIWGYEMIRGDLNDSINPKLSSHGIVFTIYDLVDSTDHLSFLYKQQGDTLQELIREMISVVTGESPVEEDKKEEDSKKETSEEWEEAPVEEVSKENEPNQVQEEESEEWDIDREDKEPE